MGDKSSSRQQHRVQHPQAERGEVLLDVLLVRDNGAVELQQPMIQPLM
jgi:hypothetical protein